MDCTEAQEVVKRASGALTQAEMSLEVMEHIGGCSACLDFLDFAVTDDSGVLNGGLVE